MFQPQWTIITLHTTYNEIFSGIQPRQDVKVCFLTFWELTLSPSSGCAGGLAEPKLMTRELSVLPNLQHTLTMGTKLGPKSQKTFTSWRGCMPEKTSLNFIAMTASRLTQIA